MCIEHPSPFHPSSDRILKKDIDMAMAHHITWSVHHTQISCANLENFSGGGGRVPEKCVLNFFSDTMLNVVCALKLFCIAVDVKAA